MMPKSIVVIVYALLQLCSIFTAAFITIIPRGRNSPVLLATRGGRDDDQWFRRDAELIEDEDDDDEAEDWTPDSVKAKKIREEARIYAESLKARSPKDPKIQSTDDEEKPRPSPYTDEEQEIIAAMGGKTKSSSRKRESGFLGDSTLKEIATDYSVPVCYIADVLCMWGVPVPINVNDRLGDLVTGEQAFALLEAVNSLDVAALQDRYSNMSLINLCAEWDIDLQSAFEMAMKEGWSLPFGVQTCLRVEQEDELLRVFGASIRYDDDDA